MNERMRGMGMAALNEAKDQKITARNSNFAFDLESEEFHAEMNADRTTICYFIAPGVKNPKTYLFYLFTLKLYFLIKS
jgi:hypothetical protein